MDMGTFNGYYEAAATPKPHQKKSGGLTYKFYPEHGPNACEWFNERGERMGSACMPFNPEVDSLQLSALKTDAKAAYRAADPELSFEDSFTGLARKLVSGHGRRIAKEMKKSLHELAAPKIFNKIAALLEQKKITFASAGIILDEIAAGKSDNVEYVIKQKQLLISDNGENERSAISVIILQQPPSLADFLGGKDSALGNLIGLAMKQKPGLNPVILRWEWEKIRHGSIHASNFST
jgi:hypothetical protein